MFEFLLGVIFVYIIISVVFNALAPKRGGCLNFLFLGWLFGRNNGNRRPPRDPRPPMGGGLAGAAGTTTAFWRGTQAKRCCCAARPFCGRISPGRRTTSPSPP